MLKFKQPLVTLEISCRTDSISICIPNVAIIDAKTSIPYNIKKEMSHINKHQGNKI